MHVDPLTGLILALAAFRITRFAISDALAEPVRQFIWNKFPPNTKFGYLFTCFWCLGFWISALTVTAYLLVPTPTYVVSLVLSISSIVGILGSKFD